MDDLTKTIALLGGGGLIAGCWAQVKALMLRASGLLITHVDATYNDSDSLALAIQSLAWSEFKSSASPFRFYSNSRWYVHSKSALTVVDYEYAGEQMRLFWDGWRPLLIGDHGRKVLFIRGTFDPDQLILRARARAASSCDDGGSRFSVRVFQGDGRASQFATLITEKGSNTAGKDPAPRGSTDAPIVARSYRLLAHDLKDIGMPHEGDRRLDSLALDETLLGALDEAKRWVKSGPWYRERQLPWRRGWLLYGPPGTGKSSVSLGLAQSLGIPLCRFDLASMNNAEFTKFWKQACTDTPCIVLVEDIDNIFRGRENLIGEMGGGLSFDHLLNTISGVESTDGVFLIITTNNLDAIDPALGVPQGDTGISSRPGRLDRAMELRSPDAAGRLKIAKRILDGATEAEIAQVVAEGANDSGAQFQERCSMQALKQFWASK